MKRYFVQTKHEDGHVSLSIHTDAEIINMFGFRDITEKEHEVYDGQEFGKLVPLYHVPAMHAPFNYHVFCSAETGEVVFEGYSPEH